MSIFERLARLARAEFNHVKAVIADRDDDSAASDVREERLARLRRAQEELDRAEAALRGAEQSAGAAAWGGARGRDADGASSWGWSDQGAAAWGADTQASHDVDRGAAAWGRAPEPARTQPQTTVYPQEVRLAYAALELPLGADKDQVQRAYRDLLSRYHPDKHGQNPELLHAANELTRRIKEARDRLLAFLG